MRQRSPKRSNLPANLPQSKPSSAEVQAAIETAGAVLRDLLDIRHKLASKLLT